MVKVAAFLFIVIALGVTWPIWGGLLFIFGPLIPAILLTPVVLLIGWILLNPLLAVECVVAFWTGKDPHWTK